jgi:hypothetical protein
VVLVGLIALLLAPPADAFPRRTLAAAAGASFLLQPEIFTDPWNDAGIALSGALRYEVLPRLSVGVEVGYFRHGLDEGAFEDSIQDEFPGVSVSGRDLWVLPVNVVGEFDLLRWGVVKPFVRAGAGVYVLGTTDFQASGFDSNRLIDDVARNDPGQTAFGTLIGLGVRTPLSLGASLSLDATYQVAATDGEATHFLPVRVVVSF